MCVCEGGRSPLHGGQLDRRRVCDQRECGGLGRFCVH